MATEQELKTLVKEKYSGIAHQAKALNLASCCGATSCCNDDAVYNIMADDYTTLEGYNADADLGLGCGIPTAFAQINPGNTVIDLGSGAGNDAFLARKATGENGKIIGIDFSETMIEKARENAAKVGFDNIEFRLGDIDNMPVTSNKADVVLSNCVLNLVPNKHKVFSEVFRVLKPGGHFCISDIVLIGELPPKWKEVAELYAGCVSGAIQKRDYMSIIAEAGFTNIAIQKEKEIVVPEEILSAYLSPEEITAFKSTNATIKSITVFATKPAKDERNCCEPGSGCC